MGKIMFSEQGNRCGDRVRLARAMHKPPLTQQQLATKTDYIGLSMSKSVISRIEKGDRHVIDSELKVLALALGVSMDWLLEEYDPSEQK